MKNKCAQIPNLKIKSNPNSVLLSASSTQNTRRTQRHGLGGWCDSHQEGGDGGADDEAGDDVRPVVAVLGHAVQTGEEGQTHEPQRQHRLGQAGALRLHRARHVHLGGEETQEKGPFKGPEKIQEALRLFGGSFYEQTMATSRGGKSVPISEII